MKEVFEDLKSKTNTLQNRPRHTNTHLKAINQIFPRRNIHLLTKSISFIYSVFFPRCEYNGNDINEKLVPSNRVQIPT